MKKKKKTGKKKRKKEKIGRKKSSLILSFLLGAFILIGIIIYFSFPISNTKEQVEIYIPAGSNASYIATLLQDHGLIKSKDFFLFFLKILGKEREIKSGYYLLSPSYSILKILNVLTQGKPITIKVTIPEGENISGIAKILKEKLGISEETFVTLCKDKNFVSGLFRNYRNFLGDDTPISLEGYLFPSTYLFPKGIKEDEIISTLLEEFFRQISRNFPDYREALEKLNLSFNDWIVLASIVEKEAKLDNERPLIAGVFLNRLKKGYKLESCATVEYLYNFQKPVLYYDDLKIDSPYNTYIYYGLPPTPIASPSIKSLMAVLSPKGDFLFFVAKGDGSHIFTRTYEEHLKAQGYKK
ncbi:MAG TPA: endolytic transglycosylase MltG [Dictyoglomaceae bacterium]|nr:endolytic transglycosylase MltG [Dictyoglomaceae bacterium]HOL40106.1 endolytic transglycosylase MltG [Dictyoglomaceae bacterium]HPP16633.1 endolytic transglycosylase MltG [Dictyoglomaceae bacterium]HPU43159.1 endolytic transglycosylase MltG [Dictyoglomaceae bacterium]